MMNDKLIRLSAAVDLCMKKAKGYQPEMFGSDQECYTAKVVATELAGEIRNLPTTDTEALKTEIEALKSQLANEKSLTQHTYECAEVFRNKAERLEKELEIREIQKNAMFAKAEQLERERDFLLKYLTDSHFVPCDICKHAPETLSVMDCDRVRKIKGPCFEWNGLCGGAEDGKEI